MLSLHTLAAVFACTLKARKALSETVLRRHSSRYFRVRGTALRLSRLVGFVVRAFDAFENFIVPEVIALMCGEIGCLHHVLCTKAPYNGLPDFSIF